MQKNYEPLPITTEVILNNIIMRIHDLSRELESLGGASLEMASKFRALGDSVSSLKSAFCEDSLSDVSFMNLDM
jgi:hypothetical protein